MSSTGVANVKNEAERIAAITDPFESLREATTRMAEAQAEVAELARLRRAIIQDLREQGLSYAQIAASAGLTRGRIHQLRHSGPPPEAAFLGAGQVVIATPLKHEGSNARPMVAAEDFTAAQRLADLARGLRLGVEFEHVPTSGDIDLNRPNLVVICGPRLSEPVANVLATDPAIQFERADDGPWTLRDLNTNTLYRSGTDSEPPTLTDVAYLARLPRPDRQGTLMIFTGIHPPGTLGVVHLITNEISDLHTQTGNASFSTLVNVGYDEDTHEPTRVELASPIYRHEV